MLKEDLQITVPQLRAGQASDKAWVAIRGRVYNVASFANRHPGGKDFLMAAVGRDATAVFESFHDPKAIKVLQKWRVGTLVESDMPQYPELSKFAKEVRGNVEEYFRLIGRDPRDAPRMLLRYAASIAVFMITYLIMFSPTVFPHYTLLPWLAAVVHGWSSAMLGLFLLHDGCHASFTRRPVVWNIMRRLYELLTGLSSVVWIHQHVLGHHPFTNVANIDPDIIQSDPGPVRIHKSQPWWSYYRWQSYYWVPLYSQLIFSRRLTEWKALFVDQRFKSMSINPQPLKEYIWAAAALLSFGMHHLVIPYYYFQIPLFRIFLTYACCDSFWSLYLMLVFQASHVNDDVSWPQPDEDGHLPDWAMLQIESSMDFGHGNFWATFLTGSLNYQAVHHLFPHVSQYYYPAIAPIVRQTCATYGVTYNVKDTLWEVLSAHIERLRGMGAPPSQSPFSLLGTPSAVVQKKCAAKCKSISEN